MSAPETVIRAYAPGDEAAINDGFNAAFGLARTLEEWRWKFPDAPFGRWITVATDGTGRVLAHYAAVPMAMQVDGLHILGGQGVDAYSRSEVRGTHLYTATVRAFHDAFGAPERMAFTVVFPGVRNARIFSARLGFASLGEVPLWCRPARQRGAWRVGHTVRHVSPDASLDDLWSRARARYAAAGIRDAAWMRRRFSSRPGIDYLHLAAVSWRGRVAAWAVVRPQAEATRWADLVWDGADVGALAALDRAIGACARQAGSQSVEMWLGGDAAAAAALARLGWARAAPRDEMLVMARSYHPEVDIAPLAGRLYLTMGDADLV